MKRLAVEWSPPEDSPLGRARLSLQGLSVGDAFGQKFFVAPSVVAWSVKARAVPSEPWYWTDDTAMALSIYEVLAVHGHVDRDALAARFADRYRSDPHRGYGGTAHSILMSISLGAPWRETAAEAFEGQGSMGNGGAMRSAPIGGYFSDDLDRVVAEARASAEPTHAHPEGQAGAIAVAVAAALAARVGRGDAGISAEALLREVIAHTPDGPTREGLARALDLPAQTSIEDAVEALGNGSRVVSQDTLPFALWTAAHHLNDYEEAMWITVSGLGDRDTTCAITGGVVALAVGARGIPSSFVAAREPLDSALTHLDRA